MKSKKIKTTIFVLLALIGFIHGLRFVKSYLVSLKEPEKINARAKGNPDAKLQIVEYSDFLCPACAKGTVVLDEYIEKYPDQIYLEYKHFPLHSPKLAITAECAARQEKFWPFHDLVFKRQAALKRSMSIQSKINAIAKEIGLNKENLDICVEDEEVLKFIMEEKSLGRKKGVRATPTYFMLDKTVVGAKKLTEELKKYFKEEEKEEAK